MLIKYKYIKITFIIVVIIALFSSSVIVYTGITSNQISSPSTIKWMDYNVSLRAMEAAYKVDVESFNTEHHTSWIVILAYLATKYGGNFSRFNTKDITNLTDRLKSGEKISDITKDMKNYAYFHEAYTAVLSQFVGSHMVEVYDEKQDDKKVWVTKYGLKAFSPIAKGYGFSHYDDFGNQRSYGYSRKHFGNDLMGMIGTPIIAVESGHVEELGWNRYGGWRIGIRSFDKKRYYYYAHLRRNSPYHKDMKQGKIVKAGDVIGYLGMTGYSNKENVNNINTPHLHFGIEIIFDEAQKDGPNQVWIDVYNIIEFLQKNKSAVIKDTSTTDYNRAYDLFDPTIIYRSG